MGLLAAGLPTSILVALTGVLNFFTVPVHTEEAHLLMYWHLGVQSAALVVFAWSAWAMRRRPVADPFAARADCCVAADFLILGSALKGVCRLRRRSRWTPELSRLRGTTIRHTGAQAGTRPAFVR